MRLFEIDTALAAKAFGLPRSHGTFTRIKVPSKRWCMFEAHADRNPDVLIMTTRFLAEGAVLAYVACTGNEVADRLQDEFGA